MEVGGEEEWKVEMKERGKRRKGERTAEEGKRASEETRMGEGEGEGRWR